MVIFFSPRLKGLAAACPYPLYAVGGRVRDALARLTAKNPDTDICAPADAEDFSARARAAGFTVDAVYKNTGTVKLSCGEEAYEFACFRSDAYVRGAHRPLRTYLTDDIALDARRRDFTCNAVYYDIAREQIVDPLGGARDIERRILCTVAPAEKVFGEDGLRLMRLARIAAQTGFSPDESCLAGAAQNAALIADVSAERIFTELKLILHAEEKYGGVNGAYGGVNGVYAGLKILDETGVLDYILPELAAGRGMGQRADFHKYDVLEHSLRCAAYADAGVRLAALLHDIGKPYCFAANGNFHGHETAGARLAERALLRLKAPARLAEETAKLVALHMYDLRGDARECRVRRFLVKSYGVLDKLLCLMQADYSACRDDFSPAPAVSKLRHVYQKMRAEGRPFTLKELAVKGDDLLALGVEPKEVGRALERLLLDCAAGQTVADRDALLKYASKIFRPQGGKKGVH